MYFKFLHKGWSVIAKAPKYLNVALPDFSVQYILASFMHTDHVVLRGQVPLASYVSLTIYDTYGLPSSSVQLTFKKNFEITVGKDLQKPDSFLYVIIFRIYQAREEIIFPTIELNKNLIKQLSISKIHQNSKTITNQIVAQLSKNLDLSIEKGLCFFLPVNANMSGLFINKDAIYLIGTPAGADVIKITGILPPKTKNTCFIGFMACNLKTTATDSSIGWDDLEKNYTIYVAFEKKKAMQYGFDPIKDKFLQWNKDNALPVIVYREVQIKHSGLFQLESNKWQDAKKVMGIYYPVITHF
jgi:hypothetical protein